MGRSLDELLEINAMWSSAYTGIWWRRKSARGTRASPIHLSKAMAVGIANQRLRNGLVKYQNLYGQCLFLFNVCLCLHVYAALRPSATYPLSRIPAFIGNQ